MKRVRQWLFMGLLAPVVTTAQAFTDDERGFSIDIDDSYRVTRNYDVTFFESRDDDSVVIIRNWPGLTREMVADYLRQGYQDERIALVPTSETREQNAENGNGLLVDVLGIVQRRLVKGVAAGYVGNGGQGMVVLISAPQDEWDAFAGKAQKIAASVKFHDAVARPESRDWNYTLAGMRLALRGTSNDRRRREDLYLCSDGSFEQRISASQIKESDSGSALGYSTKNRSGLWRVIAEDGSNRLILRYSDGREQSAIIEDRGGQTYLNGQRYYMMRNNRCR